MLFIENDFFYNFLPGLGNSNTAFGLAKGVYKKMNLIKTLKTTKERL